MTKELFKINMKAKDWRGLLKMVNTLSDECIIQINKSEILIKLVDPAHVSMLVLSYYPMFFEEYTVNKKDEIGLDHNQLKEALQGFASNDKISLRHTSDNICQFDSSLDYGNYIKRFFQVETAGMPRPKIPKLDLIREIQLHAVHFRKAVMKKTLSDYCTLSSKGDILNVHDEGDKGEVGRPTDDFNLFLLNPSSKPGKRATSKFSLDYLKDIVNCVPKKADDLTIRLGNDNPIELKYKYIKEGEILFEAIFLLAPRLESE